MKVGQAKQLKFDQESLIIALLVASDIHEGRWTLGVAFNHDVQGILLNGKRTVAAIAAFDHIVIERLDATQTVLEGATVVDAALANPKPGSLDAFLGQAN